MSMMRCDGCDAIVNTDDDVEGLFEDTNPWRFWCCRCVENGNNEALLVALKTQEPERYKELFDE